MRVHNNTNKIWLSPAKINLFLHVVSKRDDGYHNIQTIFQLLDFYDKLTFKLRDDGLINRRQGNESVPYEKDLIIRSAKLLQKTGASNLGADISIDKKIPIGGGLGGGSSNAATTLIALNKLWHTNLSKSQLMRLGSKLGADVSLFIGRHSAWAEGIGNVLTPIKLAQHYFLIIFINKKVHTKDVFSHKALTMSPPIKKTPIQNMSILKNDCLQAAITIEGEILNALCYLKSVKKYINNPRMSGTGCCVFAEFTNKKDAQIALVDLPKKWHGIITRAINTSPICL